MARVQFPVSETLFGHQELNIFFRMSKWCIFFLLRAAGNRKNIASAGNRTRINCLEGSYADHYTTDASCGKWQLFGVFKLGYKINFQTCKSMSNLSIASETSVVVALDNFCKDLTCHYLVFGVMTKTESTMQTNAT